MKEIKDHNNTVNVIPGALFSVFFVFLFSSCTSISPKYLAQNGNLYNVSKVGLREMYVFDNFPQEIPSRRLVWWRIQNTKQCLWSFIEPNYYKKDSLQYLYKTSLEIG